MSGARCFRHSVTFKPGPPEMTAEQMKQAGEMKAKGKD
jgi:hypothetical protein